MSLISTNTAISQTKGQGWRIILTESKRTCTEGHTVYEVNLRKLQTRADLFHLVFFDSSSLIL